MIENIAGNDARMEWIDEANDRQPLFPKEDNDVSGMLELNKSLLCVVKCSNTELDIILFGEISMHINGSYCNQGSA